MRLFQRINVDSEEKGLETALDSPHQGLWVKMVRRNQPKRQNKWPENSGRVWDPGNQRKCLRGRTHQLHWMLLIDLGRENLRISRWISQRDLLIDQLISGYKGKEAQGVWAQTDVGSSSCSVVLWVYLLGSSESRHQDRIICARNLWAESCERDRVQVCHWGRVEKRRIAQMTHCSAFLRTSAGLMGCSWVKIAC